MSNPFHDLVSTFFLYDVNLSKIVLCRLMTIQQFNFNNAHLALCEPHRMWLLASELPYPDNILNKNTQLIKGEIYA